MPKYDYLVLVDFQVTVGADIAEKQEQEIIEFPWVVFDITSKQVVDEKQVFVKPTLHPILTDECEKATGVGPMALETAGTIESAVQEFNDYLYRSFTANNKEFCLMACGELALKRWLRVDAKRKGVVLPAHFGCFVDLAAEFRKHYPKLPVPPPPPTPALPALASALDISLDTRSMGGLLYCRGMAQVITRLLADGADLSNATTVLIPSDYSPLSDPAWVSLRSGAAAAATAASTATDFGAAAAAGPVDDGSDFVVKCRGLPYSASDKEIREFFGDCRVLPEGVLVCLTHSGRPSGDAFVRLATLEDMQRALKKDREKIDRRYVEVFGSTVHDMEGARKLVEVARGVATKIREAVGSTEAPRELQVAPPSSASGGNWLGVVRMRGLPFSASADDIRAFFKDLSIKPDGIVLCEGRDGRPNGEAFVEFTKEAYADDAIQFHRQVLGTRYVEIFKSSSQDLTNYFQNRATGGRGPAIVPGPGEYFVKIRGIPYTSREREVIEFFTRASVVPTGVSLCYNARDQPNGEAFVEFANNDDLSRALTLNKENMGHRYVELFRTSRAEALQSLANPAHFAQQLMGGLVDPFGGNRGAGLMGQMLTAANLPGGYASLAAPDGGGAFGGGAFGGGGGAFGGGAGAFGGGGGFGGAGVGFGAGAFGGAGAYGGGLTTSGGLTAGALIGGATIKVRGLPYRATVQDIAEFFRGYSFLPELIQLGAGNDGRPNGEAWVTFVSTEEAMRAIRERNRGNIGSRYVELFSCGA